MVDCGVIAPDRPYSGTNSTLYGHNRFKSYITIVFFVLYFVLCSSLIESSISHTNDVIMQLSSIDSSNSNNDSFYPSQSSFITMKIGIAQDEPLSIEATLNGTQDGITDSTVTEFLLEAEAFGPCGDLNGDDLQLTPVSIPARCSAYADDNNIIVCELADHLTTWQKLYHSIAPCAIQKVNILVLFDSVLIASQLIGNGMTDVIVKPLPFVYNVRWVTDDDINKPDDDIDQVTNPSSITYHWDGDSSTEFTGFLSWYGWETIHSPSPWRLTIDVSPGLKCEMLVPPSKVRYNSNRRYIYTFDLNSILADCRLDDPDILVKWPSESSLHDHTTVITPIIDETDPYYQFIPLFPNSLNVASNRLVITSVVPFKCNVVPVHRITPVSSYGEQPYFDLSLSYKISVDLDMFMTCSLNLIGHAISFGEMSSMEYYKLDDINMELKVSSSYPTHSIPDSITLQVIKPFVGSRIHNYISMNIMCRGAHSTPFLSNYVISQNSVRIGYTKTVGGVVWQHPDHSWSSLIQPSVYYVSSESIENYKAVLTGNFIINGQDIYGDHSDQQFSKDLDLPPVPASIPDDIQAIEVQMETFTYESLFDLAKLADGSNQDVISIYNIKISIGEIDGALEKRQTPILKQRVCSLPYTHDCQHTSLKCNVSRSIRPITDVSIDPHTTPCQCHDGWIGPYCHQTTLCSDVYYSVFDECNGNGYISYDPLTMTCSSTCACLNGFTGIRCEVDPKCEKKTPICNRNSFRPFSMVNDQCEGCECQREYSGQNCLTYDCLSQYSALNRCSGRGTVYKNNKNQCNDTCACDYGWYGPQCEHSVKCIDIYQTLNECNNDGIIGYNTDTQSCNAFCTCNALNNSHNVNSQYNQLNDCNNHGIIVYDDIHTCKYKCQCSNYWSGDLCEIQPVSCSGKCDNITSFCGADGQCICRDALSGWMIKDDPQSSIQSCERPCTCLNQGECVWKSSIMECKCKDGYTGKLCQDAPPSSSSSSNQCNATSFLPSICVKGTITCPEGRHKCTCADNWVTNISDNNNNKYECNICQLQDPSTDYPHKYCHPTNTHRVSYTTSRCANDICVCNKGYTGDTCQYNAAYAEIIFDPTTILSFDASQFNDPIEYMTALKLYLVEYITNHPIIVQNNIISSMVDEWITLYNTSINSTPAQESSNNSNNNTILGIIQSKLSSLLDPFISTSESQWTCPEGQIPTSDHKCITRIVYTFQINSTLFTEALQGKYIEKSDHVSNDYKVQSTADISALFGAWDDAIDDMSSNTSSGGTLLTDSLGSPSTGSIYDELYCNMVKAQPNPVIPPQCLQEIQYHDNTWTNEADEDDAKFTVIIHNDSDKASNVGIIVGVVVGACVLFIIVMILILYLKKTQQWCFAKQSKKVSSSTTTASSKSPQSVEITSKSHENKSDKTKSPHSSELPPSSLPSPVSATSSSSPAQTINRPLPDGWKLLHDPNSGKQYYYNENTLTSSWVHPNDINDAATSSLW